jgi:hypothetical protein
MPEHGHCREREELRSNMTSSGLASRPLAVQAVRGDRPTKVPISFASTSLRMISHP